MPDDPRDRKRRTPALGIPPPLGQPSDTAETIRQLGRTQRDTQQTVSNTLDRVGDLRRELGGRIDQLDAQVGELAVCSARVEGKLDILVDTLHQDRNERSAIRVSTVQASIEVEKTGEVAKISEVAAVRAHQRQVTLKALAVAGPIIAAALGLLAGRC